MVAVLGHQRGESSQPVLKWVIQTSLVSFDMEIISEFRVMGELLCDGYLGGPQAPAYSGCSEAKN